MGNGFGFVVETKQNLIEISRLQKIRKTSRINNTQVGLKNDEQFRKSYVLYRLMFTDKSQFSNSDFLIWGHFQKVTLFH